MHDMLADTVRAETAEASTSIDLGVGEGARVRLSVVKPGDRGRIVDVRAESHPGGHGVTVDELQRRLLEFGFVEGAQFEVLCQGAIWKDPIALKLDDMRVALRRRDAEDVWVQLDTQ